MMPMTIREKRDSLRMETFNAIKGKVRECVEATGWSVQEMWWPNVGTCYEGERKWRMN